MAAGARGDQVIFSGVGKTRAEMAQGLQAGIACFNVESESELRRLSAIASGSGKRAPVSLRVNPDVDARTHHKIATGKSENKFGIPISRARAVYAEAATMPSLEVTGVDMHIGSQITDLGPFRAAFARVAALIAELRADLQRLKRDTDSGRSAAAPIYAETSPASGAAMTVSWTKRLDVSFSRR